MSGLHSLSVGQSHRDAVLGGEFANAGFVRAIEVASTMAWQSSDGLRAGNKVLQEKTLFKTKNLQD